MLTKKDRTRIMKNPNVKAALIQLDNSILATLIEVSQFALNDIRSINRVSKELGLKSEQVEGLAGLAIELSASNGEKPSITTMNELDVFANEFLLIIS